MVLKHSFHRTILITFILSLITGINALPATPYHNRVVRRQFSASSAMAEPTLSSTNADTQTIRTSQTFTSPDGNTTEICTFIRTPTLLPNGNEVIVLSKNCTSSFTPADATATVVSSASLTSSITTIVTSAIPVSTTSIASTTSDTPTTTMSSPTSNTPSSLGSPNDSDSTPSLSASATLATATSPAIEQTASQGRSTLPIFLGAFGGFAVLALLFVAIKVYNPMQYFYHLRLNPPTCLTRLKSRCTWIRPTAGGYGAEKGLTSRTSHESSAQTSRWSTDTSPHSGWIS